MRGPGVVLACEKLLHAQPLISLADSAAPGAHHDQRLKIQNPPERTPGNRDDRGAKQDGQQGLERTLGQPGHGVRCAEEEVRQVDELVQPEDGGDEEEGHGLQRQDAAEYDATDDHELISGKRQSGAAPPYDITASLPPVLPARARHRLTPGRTRTTFNHMVKSSAHDLDLVFRALADPTRRVILKELAGRERTVTQVAKPFRMSLVAVSKHLKVLERARLIRRRRDGSFHYLRLNPEALQSAEQWLRHYEQFWHPRLDSLKQLLEQETS